MLTFLRKIRRSLIDTGSTQKYLLYAIGEITLVVIGILIALQINNWNEGNKQNKREQQILRELAGNLKTNVSNLNNDIQVQILSADIIDFLIDHIENKRPFHDSLAYLFTRADYAPDVILTSSAFETLKSSGLELIRSNELRMHVIDLFEVTYPYLLQETKRIEDQVWPAVVVPMTQKHFKVGQEKLIPNDYSALLSDHEYINMLSMRVNMRRSSTNHKRVAKARTEEVISLIKKELENRK